jgi:hypothetical protein
MLRRLKLRLFSKAHESLKGSYVGSQGVSISLLIPQVEWSRDRVYEEGVL